MDERYIEWVNQNLNAPSTRQNAISTVQRLEREYGNLDPLYDEDGLEWIMSELEYNSLDEHEGKGNPSKLEINGNLRKCLSSHRSWLRHYIRFRQEAEGQANYPPTVEHQQNADLSFRYEQDLQTALIACIDQVEPGMTLVEDGKEYQVPSGRIDALARDAQGNTVVIELKAVTAKREVLGQIAAYMADISDETNQRPRGILIAPDFDDKLLSGARMIENLKLMRYAFSFTFSDV